MTSIIEKKFFNTFGIKQKEPTYITMNCNCGCHDCKNCEKYKKNYLNIYPQITDRILLELICKLSCVCRHHFAFERGVPELKEAILKFCIYYKDQLKQQVRILFEEE